MQRRIARWITATSLVAAAALAVTGCSSGFSSGGSSSSALTHEDKPLKVLIGSSGDAETTAVKDAVADWSKSSGTSASVSVASDINQQLSQGFAAGKPADVFYLTTDYFGGYAANGSLLSYGDRLKNKGDFYPALTKAFTSEGKLVCAPKDFSTLQLIINEDKWTAAGLTDADVPKTWTQLQTVAKTLTSGSTTGLVMNPGYTGVFMVQAGGGYTNAAGTKATLDSKANIDGLDYAKKLLDDGAMKFSADAGAGWGGEALGKGLGAMTIEGNWIVGAMKTDYPDVNYKVVDLPAGPEGQGTLDFTSCWGIAADSPNQAAALKLVESLTTAKQQLAFSKAFGPLPSVESAKSDWLDENPSLAPFLTAADYAKGIPNQKGSADALNDLTSQLEKLATSDPKTILTEAQANFAAIID